MFDAHASWLNAALAVAGTLMWTGFIAWRSWRGEIPTRPERWLLTATWLIVLAEVL